MTNLPDPTQLLIKALTTLRDEARAGRISWMSTRMEHPLKKHEPSAMTLLYRRSQAEDLDGARSVVVPAIESTLELFQTGHLRVAHLENEIVTDSNLVTLKVKFEAKAP